MIKSFAYRQFERKFERLGIYDAVMTEPKKAVPAAFYFCGGLWAAIVPFPIVAAWKEYSNVGNPIGAIALLVIAALIAVSAVYMIFYGMAKREHLDAAKIRLRDDPDAQEQFAREAEHREHLAEHFAYVAESQSRIDAARSHAEAARQEARAAQLGADASVEQAALARAQQKDLKDRKKDRRQAEADLANAHLSLQYSKGSSPAQIAAMRAKADSAQARLSR
jgi:hypothetical protein